MWDAGMKRMLMLMAIGLPIFLFLGSTATKSKEPATLGSPLGKVGVGTEAKIRVPQLVVPGRPISTRRSQLRANLIGRALKEPVLKFKNGALYHSEDEEPGNPILSRSKADDNELNAERWIAAWKKNLIDPGYVIYDDSRPSAENWIASWKEKSQRPLSSSKKDERDQLAAAEWISAWKKNMSKSKPKSVTRARRKTSKTKSKSAVGKAIERPSAEQWIADWKKSIPVPQPFDVPAYQADHRKSAVDWIAEWKHKMDVPVAESSIDSATERRPSAQAWIEEWRRAIFGSPVVKTNTQKRPSAEEWIDAWKNDLSMKIGADTELGRRESAETWITAWKNSLDIESHEKKISEQGPRQSAQDWIATWKETLRPASFLDSSDNDEIDMRPSAAEWIAVWKKLVEPGYADTRLGAKEWIAAWKKAIAHVSDDTAVESQKSSYKFSWENDLTSSQQPKPGRDLNEVLRTFLEENSALLEFPVLSIKQDYVGAREDRESVDEAAAIESGPSSEQLEPSGHHTFSRQEDYAAKSGDSAVKSKNCIRCDWSTDWKEVELQEDVPMYKIQSVLDARKGEGIESAREVKTEGMEPEMKVDTVRHTNLIEAKMLKNEPVQPSSQIPKEGKKKASWWTDWKEEDTPIAEVGREMAGVSEEMPSQNSDAAAYFETRSNTVERERQPTEAIRPSAPTEEDKMPMDVPALVTKHWMGLTNQDSKKANWWTDWKEESHVNESPSPKSAVESKAEIESQPRLPEARRLPKKNSKANWWNDWESEVDSESELGIGR